MTAPVVHGYPDFGRFTATAAKIFHHIVGQAYVDILVTAPVFVGDQTHLGYTFVATGARSQVRAAFYSDESQTFLLGLQTVVCNDGGGFNFSMPALGPWLVLIVENNIGAASFNLDVWGISGPVASSRFFADDSLLIQGNSVSVGAGAVVTLDATDTWAGDAQFFVSTIATTWFIRLFVLNVSGTQIQIGGFNQTTAGPQTRSLILPPMPVRITIENSDAVSRGFALCLNGRPIAPGV